MSFHNPGAWWWAGLALLVVVFYVARIAPQRREVATFWLWQRALARRPAWFVLRFWLSLAAQVFVLLLLVAALAQPYWKAAYESRRNIILLLDVSASMSAADVPPSRFAAMQAEAQRIIAGLQFGERLQIVSVGSVVATKCRFTDEQPALLAAVQSLKPTDGVAHMDEALAAARQVLADKTNPRIVAVTDGAFPGAETLAQADDVRWLLVRGAGNNVAITRFELRPVAADDQQYDVLVEVLNAGADRVECPLTLTIPDQPPIETSVTLDAGATVREFFTIPVPASALVTARIAVDDELPADNQASILVSGRRRPLAVLVAAEQTPEVAALQAALQADERLEVQVVPEPPAAIPPHAVLVFHRTVPNPLPPRPALVVDPRTPCDLWQLGGPLRDAACQVRSTQRSPLLASVRFQDFVIEEATKVTFSASAAATPLVETQSGDALYSALERDAGRVLVLHLGLQKEKCDLVLRADFPVLVQQAVQWLRAGSDPPPLAVRTGETVRWPEAKSPRRLTAGPEVAIALPEQQTAAVLDRAGVWLADAAGDEPQFALPSNLHERSESDLQAGRELSAGELDAGTSVREQPLWMLLAAATVILLIVEWCLYHRRIVV